MTKAEILQVLKQDLQIAVGTKDTYLMRLIDQATDAIQMTGITLEDTVGDGMLVENYAAFLFRGRREDGSLPRSLDFRLKSRLIHEKGAVQDGD